MSDYGGDDRETRKSLSTCPSPLSAEQEHHFPLMNDGYIFLV